MFNDLGFRRTTEQLLKVVNPLFCGILEFPIMGILDCTRLELPDVSDRRTGPVYSQPGATQFLWALTTESSPSRFSVYLFG